MDEIYRGDSYSVEITLTETSDVTTFLNTWLLLTFKPALDSDITDSNAVLEKEVFIDTDVNTYTFTFTKEEMLVPKGIYEVNLRLLNQAQTDCLSSSNFNVKVILGATQRFAPDD